MEKERSITGQLVYKKTEVLNTFIEKKVSSRCLFNFDNVYYTIERNEILLTPHELIMRRNNSFHKERLALERNMCNLLK